MLQSRAIVLSVVLATLILNACSPSTDTTAMLLEMTVMPTESGFAILATTFQTQVPATPSRTPSPTTTASETPHATNVGVIPTQANIPTEPTSEITGDTQVHVVQRGENLTLISNLYDVSVEQLLIANNLQSWQVLIPDQILVIPDGSNPIATRQPTIVVPTRTQSAPVVSANGLIQHEIQRGESLTTIANRYNVTVDDLLSTNGMYRTQTLFVGQLVTIPIEAPTLTPSPTIDPNDPDAIARQVRLSLDDLSLPGQVNNLPYNEFFALSDNVINNIREIYAQGQMLGRNPNAFTRIGDSTIEAPHFFYRFDETEYNLGEFTYLQPTIDYYSGSFGHDSVGVIRGLHSWSVFDPMWAPSSCDVGEHMLACEFRIHNPSVIFIRLGTNDRGQLDLTRETFQAIVQYCIDEGVIPILGTKADRFDGTSNSVNTIIRDIAQEYAIPLWDFDLVAGTLPNHGLTTDNVHLSVFYAHDWRLTRGFTTGHGLHNLTGLIVLDELLQVLTDN